MKKYFAHSLIIIFIFFGACESNDSGEIVVSGYVYQAGNDSAIAGVHVSIGYYIVTCTICGDYDEGLEFVETASTETDSNGFYKIQKSSLDTGEDWYIEVRLNQYYIAQSKQIDFGETQQDFFLEKR